MNFLLIAKNKKQLVSGVAEVGEEELVQVVRGNVEGAADLLVGGVEACLEEGGETGVDLCAHRSVILCCKDGHPKCPLASSTTFGVFNKVLSIPFTTTFVVGLDTPIKRSNKPILNAKT